MKKSLGNVIKFKKAKPPLNKKIIGNYCLLEPLNIRKHSLQLYKNFLRDKKIEFGIICLMAHLIVTYLLKNG